MASTAAGCSRTLGWDILATIWNCQSDEQHAPIVFSPYSLAVALGMLAGAAGPDQRAQLCARLGISSDNVQESSTDISTYFSQAQARYSHDETPLSIANALFLQDTIDIAPIYNKFLQSFDADISQSKDLSKETDRINAWISEKTLNRINDMLNPRHLKDAEAVLINALAFTGTWKDEFHEKDTKQAYPFHVLPDQTREVAMMFRHMDLILVSESSLYTVVSLPYKPTKSDLQLFFEAYLPSAGKTPKEVLDHVRISKPKLLDSVKLRKFGLPKFKMEEAYDLTSTLEDLGFPLHGGWPELGTGKTPGPSRDIVFQKAMINVHEKGTEAAAATAIIMPRGMPRPVTKDIVFDRPFLYRIHDQSGQTFFAGVYT